MYPVRDYVDLGGLLSYGYRNAEMFRVAATYVDKILNGAKPGEIPLTIWDRHYLTVNAGTASALGLVIPAAILSQADVESSRHGNARIREEVGGCVMDERDVTAVPPATALAIAALPYVGQWRMNIHKSD
jgi:hypothetical protein